MFIPREPSRSPADLWSVLGEHPTQRHNDMLAERLHHLAGLPDRRPHRVRGLIIRLQTIWFRRVADKPLPRVQQGSLDTVRPEQAAPSEPLHGVSWL